MKSEKVRNAQIEQLLTRLAAEYIRQESSTQSLITVTRVSLTDFGKRAIIFISVLPETEERPALSFIDHHLGELREYVRDNSDLRVLPHLSVELDPESKLPRLS